ncbi:Aldolase-type TIM barrel [Penicillium concentricum]|uniref:Transaldolase n=1 Tax=Penicillium concentricum TaxID=293559 RepID=A0A9W9RHJ0_9EURO|nr:Aldolase-type TIM barrel [Penicillium concentricum]KAJ5360231.1 Aldolase-type TIM barrel [Penicillium concentricum]
MVVQTGLDYMRLRTLVDCDTMDDEVGKTLGPFQDCTSNQAIALGELSKPARAEVIAASRTDAMKLHPKYSSIGIEELAAEIAMVRLAVGMAKHIRGRVHVQVNPYYSYSSDKIVVNALRIVQLFQHVQPGFDADRISIKIPSTWEGMMACRTLELAGVRTLATTLFSMAQAVLAAEVGCTYIAPYVNELKVHVETGYVDNAKLLPLCAAIQKYYKSINSPTKVLPASLTSVEEIFFLAGVDHLTIAPGLLTQLTQPYAGNVKSLFDIAPTLPIPARGVSFINDPGSYQITFARDLGGASHIKLTEFACKMFPSQAANFNIEALSGICGSISIACWVVVFSPQIIENFRRGSADGLSLIFLIIWLAGDVFNILGAVLQGVLPTMIILAVYYTLADIVLLGQCFYYRGFNLKEELSPSATPDLFASNGTSDAERNGAEHQPEPTETSSLIPKPSGQAVNVTGQLPQDRTRPLSSGRRQSATSYHDIFNTSVDGTHLSPATPFIEPTTDVARRRAQRARRRRISALQSIFFNLTAVALVCAAGVMGWFVSPAAKSSSPGPEPLAMDVLGQVFGYFCAVLYLGSRLPQLLLNYRRKSTDGVSLLFFLFACIGNLTYVLSILAYSPICHGGSPEEIMGHRHRAQCRPGEAAALYGRYVLVNLSWLVGSAGTLLLDMAIFTQFFLYHDGKVDEEEE